MYSKAAMKLTVAISKGNPSDIQALANDLTALAKAKQNGYQYSNHDFDIRQAIGAGLTKLGV